MALSFILLANRVIIAAPQNTPETGVGTNIESSIVADGLNNPTDFSVVNGGEVVFVAELGSKQIRRFRASGSEGVIELIGNEEEIAEHISVYAIDSQTVLVGVKGSFEPIHSLAAFRLPQEGGSPMDFFVHALPPPRIFERSIKRSKSFDVHRFLANARSVSFVYEAKGKEKKDDKPLRLADAVLKQQKINSIDDSYKDPISQRLKLSTLTVDSLGGYFAAMSIDGDAVVYASGDGDIVDSFPIDLPGVKSLAFAPQSHRLFALVALPAEGDQSEEGDEPETTAPPAGVFEIVADGDSCKTKLTLEVDRPKLMKFDGQGNAWILCGTDDGQKGLLRKISGLDTPPPRTSQQEENSDAN